MSHIDGLIYHSHDGTVTPSSVAAADVHIHTADDTPLGNLWDTVVDPIRLIVGSAIPDYSSVAAGRLAQGPGGSDLSPGTVLVAVPPGSTDADTALEVSEEIFTLLDQHGVDDAMVEWTEAEVTML
ncbi:hypothetical protein DFP72DRAFT_915709 [Ephemerocybe angulata]|uniref:Uncharacterized protein n=1 Tax=Ephemerocybe angulata TaxID=980116 RepID=A0A8H6HLH3_9AGAR|nr:hypothetical protein DFP72DRAFT_915709 [Tulosesus angulatus]